MDGGEETPRDSAEERPSRAPRKRESITFSFAARDYLSAHPVDPSLVPGALNAIARCLALSKGQRLVLVVESGHESIGAALLDAARQSELEVTPFLVSPSDAVNSPFVKRIATHLVDADGSIFVGSTGGLPITFRHAIIDAGGTARRHAHMTGITEEMMRQSMRSNYAEVALLGERVLAVVGAATELKVRTGLGTDLTIRLSEQMRWHHGSGLIGDGEWSNLPGGELFTTPVSVDGVLVPDGGLFLPAGIEHPRAHRLALHFEGGVLVDVKGVTEDDPLSMALDEVTNLERVGQVGFGTNSGIVARVGALLQDLKAPGFHLTLGHPAPEVTGADWTCDVEVPVLVRLADVQVDGTPLLVRGRYAQQFLAPIA